MDWKKSTWLRNAGYTITEAVTVVGAMGVVAAFAAPNIIRLKAALEVQEATAQVGGVLQRTRARAASEGIPFLFLVQKEDVAGGERSPFALIVRDNDRSYSVTPPDDVETFVLEPGLRPEIRQYGEGEAAASTDIPRAYSDATALRPAAADPSETSLSGSGSGSSGNGSSGSGSGSSGSGSGGLLGGVGELVGGLLGGGSGSSGSGSSGSGSGSSGSGEESIEETVSTSTPSEQASERLSDAVENGSTFPVSEDAGVPGVAFNERGIPVSMDSPNDWGSGAGAIYLTDNENGVYAAVMSPLGEVSISRYDSGSGTWR